MGNVGNGYVREATCTEKHHNIENQLENIKKVLDEIKEAVNPKVELVVEHQQWIVNHDKKSLKSWQLVGILIAATGGVNGIIAIIEKLIAK